MAWKFFGGGVVFYYIIGGASVINFSQSEPYQNRDHKYEYRYE